MLHQAFYSQIKRNVVRAKFIFISVHGSSKLGDQSDHESHDQKVHDLIRYDKDHEIQIMNFNEVGAKKSVGL
jgi:hypothetical protein